MLKELKQNLHFFGVNYGIISMLKVVRRKLRQHMTLLRQYYFYMIGFRFDCFTVKDILEKNFYLLLKSISLCNYILALINVIP